MKVGICYFTHRLASKHGAFKNADWNLAEMMIAAAGGRREGIAPAISTICGVLLVFIL